MREERGIEIRELEQPPVYFGGKSAQTRPIRYLTSPSNLAYRRPVAHIIRRRCQKGVSG